MTPVSSFGLGQYRRGDSPLIGLVKVYLTTPSTKTLNLSTNYLATPDHTQWEGVITSIDPILASSTYLGTGMSQVTCGFVMATRAAFGYQDAELDNVTEALRDYRWTGAKVEIYLWQQLLTSWSDALPVFTGVVSSIIVSGREIRIGLVQRTDWQRRISPTIVGRDKFPRASESAVGKCLPIFYGAIKTHELRQPPWTAAYNRAAHDLEHIVGGQLGVPAIQVDTGLGGSAQRAKFLIAGHAVKVHNEFTNSICSYFLRHQDLLVPIEPTNVVNDANGAGFELEDAFDDASFPILPVDVPSGITAPGDNLRNAIDANNEVTFARLIYQPSGPTIDKRRGRWRLPDVSPPGDADLTRVYVRMLYKTSSSFTGFVVGLVRNQSPTTANQVAVSASTTPVGASFGPFNLGDWGNQASAPVPTGPWLWSEVDIEGYWSSLPGARQDIFIYAIGLEVAYRPTFKIARSGYTIPAVYGRKQRNRREREGAEGRVEMIVPPTAVGSDVDFDADFYGTAEGMADDGSGTYTGVASALIERPCDIARHLLTTYGGQSAGQFETGTEASIITNPSFETDLTGWVTSGTATVERNSNGGTDFGRFSVKVTSTGSSNRGFRYAFSGISDGTYTVSAWYKRDGSVAGEALLLLVWDLAVGGQASASVPMPDTDGKWVRAKLTTTISGIHASGTGYVECPRYDPGTTATNIVIEVDAVKMEAGADATPYGVLGSFVEARTNMATFNGLPLKAALHLSEISDAETVLHDLASAGHAQVFIDRFTDKWVWVPWKPGDGTNYNRKVWRDDIVDFHVEVSPTTRVPSGFRIMYAYDYNRKQFLKSVHCSTNASSGGHKYQDIRMEQAFTVQSGVNDKLDFAVSGFNGTKTLTAGAYADGHALAKEVDTQMETVAATDFMVCYGTTVEAGYNDKLDFSDGTTRAITIPAGTYFSMEELCAAVAAGMNAVSTGNWVVTYSRTTRKVFFNRTAGGTEDLLCSSGANKATSIYPLLGWPSGSDVSLGVGLEGANIAGEGLFHLECLTGALDLLWKSGTNGSDATSPINCAELLGFSASWDRDAGGATRHWVADCPRFGRERVMADAAAAYGQTRELTMELRGVYDTDTALTRLQRMVDALKVPKALVRFSTTKMPDLRRGEIIRFDDLDKFGVLFPAYGSNGLWAGRKFRVLAVLQRMGPTFTQEVECIEN